MRLYFCCYLALIVGSAGVVQAQQKNPDAQRVYENTYYRNDSSRIQSTLRVGGALAAQYNESLDAPLSVGAEENGALAGIVFEYGSNGDNADLNLFPELSLGADGIIAEYFRYRVQFSYAEYGFDWSDGTDGFPAYFGIPVEPYYRNSAQAVAFKFSAGVQGGGTYFLLGVGYGTYLSAGHGIGASPSPSAVYSEEPSSLIRWELTAGKDIPLSGHKLYLSPEIFYSNNRPTNHPSINFIPNTFSFGVRLNLQWVLFEHYRQIEEKQEFIYAEGHILDCKTSQPLAARVNAIDPQNGEIVESQLADSAGRFEFRLLQGKDYRFIANQPGYLPDSVSLQEFIYAEGHILDCKTSQPLAARVDAIDRQSGEMLESQLADSAGRYEFRLLQGKNYCLIINQPGYLPDSVSMSAYSAQNNELPTILLCSRTVKIAEDSSILVEGNISACDRQMDVQSVVRFIEPSSNTVVSKIHTDSSGKYQTNIPKAGRYLVQVDAAGYFPYDETVDLTRSDRENNIPLRMKEILVCDSVNLQSHFDFDSYNLKSDATPYVDRIAEYLKNNPTMSISIEGHTDNIGTRSHNLLLSRDRANAIKAYLLAKGVQENQIASVAWFGPDKPIGDNETEEGRQKNRRVDLKEINRKDH